MKITEISYTKRFNLGDYQHAEYKVNAQIEEGEDSTDGMMKLKKMVEDGHVDAVRTKAADAETKIKKAKSQKPKEVEEDDTEEAEEEEVPEEKVAAKESKKFKKKGSTYLRSNETHKLLFAKLLAEHFPTWKKDEKSKTKAKKASMRLDGEEFLDADGQVIPEFVAQLKKSMTGK